MWLPGLKYYELTDAHSDIWARFVAPVLSKPSSDNDVLRAAYGASSEFLSRATDVKEGTLNFFHIQEARMDGPIPSAAGLCLSYVKFVLVNGAVTSPHFGVEKADAMSIQTLQKPFPIRQVVQIYLKDIALNGGAIHCVTQQTSTP